MKKTILILCKNGLGKPPRVLPPAAWGFYLERVDVLAEFQMQGHRFVVHHNANAPGWLVCTHVRSGICVGNQKRRNVERSLIGFRGMAAWCLWQCKDAQTLKQRGRLPVRLNSTGEILRDASPPSPCLAV